MAGRIFGRLRAWLLGGLPPGTPDSRRDAAALVAQVSTGGVSALSDTDLMALVGVLLHRPELRAALRGNARFLESVSAQYARKQTISPRQRAGITNILERAYPHNLAAELSRLAPRR